mmetsp:Transcript_8725/g.26823  ORF Transcript_8725/g.26823 Transcript_8725/m.26823 type:complete len:239 (-) Transcript_8725:549-1265(-)
MRCQASSASRPGRTTRRSGDGRCRGSGRVRRGRQLEGGAGAAGESGAVGGAGRWLLRGRSAVVRGGPDVARQTRAASGLRRRTPRRRRLRRAAPRVRLVQKKKNRREAEAEAKTDGRRREPLLFWGRSGQVLGAAAPLFQLVRRRHRAGRRVVVLGDARAHRRTHRAPRRRGPLRPRRLLRLRRQRDPVRRGRLLRLGRRRGRAQTPHGPPQRPHLRRPPPHRLPPSGRPHRSLVGSR